MRKRYGVFLFFAFLLLGMLATAQFRTVMNEREINSSNKYETEQLKAMIKQEKDEIAKLKAAIVENEKKRDANLKAVVNSNDNSNLTQQHSKLNDIKLKAGLTDVKGQGIVLKLDDAPARVNAPSWLKSNLVIHDADIKILINELKMAGAQAIAINDERLISTSEQVCAGPTILINKNRYPVPYTIKAVGSLDALYKAMDESERLKLMRNDGIRVTLERLKEVTIPKYNNELGRSIEGLEVAE